MVNEQIHNIKITDENTSTKAMPLGLKATIFFSIIMGIMLCLSFLIFPLWLVPILVLIGIITPVIGLKPVTGFFLLVALFPLAIVGTAAQHPLIGGVTASGVKILGFVVIISFLVSRVTTKETQRYIGIDVFAILFLLINGLSLFIPALAGETSTQLTLGFQLSWIITYIQLLLMWFLSVNLIANQTTLRHLLWVIVIATAISAILAIIQSNGTSIDAQQSYAVRATGGMSDPNDFSAFLNMAFFMGMGIFLGEKSFIKKMLLLGMGLVILIAIVSTLSRGGTAAFLGTLSYLLIRMRRKWGGIIFILIIVSLLIPFIPEVYLERISVRYTTTDPSALSRIYAWKAALIIWSKHPIMGIGLGNFYFTVPRYLPAGYIKNMVAHNAYLQVLVETGLLGFMFFIAMIWRSLRNIRLFSPPIFKELSSLSLGIELGFIAILLSSVFLSIQHSKALWLLLSLGGVLQAMSRRTKGDLAAKGKEE